MDQEIGQLHNLLSKDDNRLEHLEFLMEADLNANQSQVLTQPHEQSLPDDYMSEAEFE